MPPDDQETAHDESDDWVMALDLLVIDDNARIELTKRVPFEVGDIVDVIVFPQDDETPIWIPETKIQSHSRIRVEPHRLERRGIKVGDRVDIEIRPATEIDP